VRRLLLLKNGLQMLSKKMTELLDKIVCKFGSRKTEIVLNELMRNADNQAIPLNTLKVIVCSELHLPFDALHEKRGFNGKARIAKMLFAQIAATEFSATNAEISRFLGVRTLCTTAYLRDFQLLNDKVKGDAQIILWHTNITSAISLIVNQTKPNE